MPTEEGEASGEEGNSVAVCLFDPEALSPERLEELCNQEAKARQEVERSFSSEPAKAPAALAAGPQVRYQEGTSVVCFQDPAGVQIVEDHFVRGAGADSRKFDPPPSAPRPKLAIVVNCEDLSLALYQGFDFDAGLRCRSKESLAEQTSRFHLMVQFEGFGAKFMAFPPTPVPTSPVLPGSSALPIPANTYRWRLALCARDFGILDRVHKSVFSHVLSYFEDEAKRPRPSMADMLFFRVDELIHHTVEPSSSTAAKAPTDAPPEYRAELRMLPLQLTVDQDSVDFLADFLQLCSLSTYVEEHGDDKDFLGPLVEAEETEEEPPTPAAGQAQVTPETPQVALFFQKVTVGSLLLSVDYKAKRLDVEALRRGELWELVNLLPLLEGLQVHFRSVSVSNARGAEQVLSQVVRAWSADLNRTQILRSLTGVTPIRSFANIGGGFAEMVLEPLKQYRQGQNAERVSRTMLRGLISFLRHVTIESIDLTERVFVGAQAALEYANTRLGSDAPRRPPAPRPVDVAGSPPAGRGGDWLPVERGAASFLQPGGAAEGLQEASSSLTRGLRNAGPFLVRPLLEIQRGASREQVFRSVVSGIPMCVLRPALGATTAAATAIRGVRNSVDPSHRREMVRKYRGPG